VAFFSARRPPEFVGGRPIRQWIHALATVAANTVAGSASVYFRARSLKIHSLGRRQPPEREGSIRPQVA